MPNATDDNATTWRELASQLTPEQIAQFEHYEALAQNVRDEPEVVQVRRENAQDVLNGLLAHAHAEAERSLTDKLFDHVAMPAGATVAEHWEDDGHGQWTRLVHGTHHGVGHLSVGLSGEQQADGTVTWTAYANADDDPTTPEQLRRYAAALTEAANELDRLQ
jgi:hypothetical protein